MCSAIGISLCKYSKVAMEGVRFGLRSVDTDSGSSSGAASPRIPRQPTPSGKTSPSLRKTAISPHMKNGVVCGGGMSSSLSISTSIQGNETVNAATEGHFILRRCNIIERSTAVAFRWDEVESFQRDKSGNGSRSNSVTDNSFGAVVVSVREVTGDGVDDLLTQR